MEKKLLKIEGIRFLDVVLSGSFFLSGCCALVYQIGWQRILYGIVGVDIDSITIIVSVFMFGIGVGGMLGGRVADIAPHHRIKYYAIAEFSIAIYGLVSVELLQYLGEWLTLTRSDALWSGAASFLFLIVPTVLMGMTLPLLTMAFNEWNQSVGVSVGRLYFFNTLGAAMGAGVVPFVLFPRWALNDVIFFAVMGNVFVGITAIVAYRRQMSLKNKYSLDL